MQTLSWLLISGLGPVLAGGMYPSAITQVVDPMGGRVVVTVASFQIMETVRAGQNVLALLAIKPPSHTRFDPVT